MESSLWSLLYVVFSMESSLSTSGEGEYPPGVGRIYSSSPKLVSLARFQLLSLFALSINILCLELPILTWRASSCFLYSLNVTAKCLTNAS